MSLIYISEFSKENIKIGEKFKETDNKTLCLLWKNIDSEKSKEDFDSIMDNPNLKNFYIIDKTPNSIDFAKSIFSFIKCRKLYPDNLVIRGFFPEIWPLAIMKLSLLIQTQCHLILNDATLPLESYEKDCLDSFDFIYSMSPFAFIDDYYFKTTKIFKKFNSSKFNIIPKYIFNVPEVSSPTVFCNTENIEIISKKVENEELEASIINIDDVSDEDLYLFSIVSENIIDESGDDEFSLILSKIGKKGVSLKDFVKEYKCLFPDVEKNIEDFSNNLVKTVSGKFGTNKGKDIVSFEIS